MKALITGASSGIGEEFARLYAAKGFDLAIVARTKSALNRLKKDLEKKHDIAVQVVVQDLSNLSSAKKLKSKVKDVTVLINNAGFGKKEEFEKSNYKTNQDMMLLNMVTLTNLTKLFLPDLIKNKGGIINVASIAGFLPGPGMNVYYATKSYVLSFTEALAEELKGKVAVTCLCPGPTKTGFEEEAGTNFGNKSSSAKNVAKYGYESLKKKRVVAVHGLSYRILLALTKVFPRSWKRRISKNAVRDL